MYGIIYRAYLQDGRSYVGQTVKRLKKRINEHKCNASCESDLKTHFYNAARKYGFDAFRWEILEECKTKKELDECEIKWIKKFNSIENGFNVKTGGSRGKNSDEMNQKLSEQRTGAGNPMFGKPSWNRGKRSERLHVENIKTKFQEGNRPWNEGGGGYSAKKTLVKDLLKIKELFEKGMLYREISEIVGIKKKTVGRIIREKLWIKFEEGFSEAQEIRRKYSSGKYTGKQLAEEYGRSLTGIYSILHNRRWRE